MKIVHDKTVELLFYTRRNSLKEETNKHANLSETLYTIVSHLTIHILSLFAVANTKTPKKTQNNQPIFASKGLQKCSREN